MFPSLLTRANSMAEPDVSGEENGPGSNGPYRQGK